MLQRTSSIFLMWRTIDKTSLLIPYAVTKLCGSSSLNCVVLLCVSAGGLMALHTERKLPLKGLRAGAAPCCGCRAPCRWTQSSRHRRSSLVRRKAETKTRTTLSRPFGEEPQRHLPRVVLSVGVMTVGASPCGAPQSSIE